MIISMYQASVPRFVNILGNLSNILDKAQVHVDAKKLDTATLTTYRLFPDMLPMTPQVQIACDTAKGVVARLAGVEIPVYEDNEKTLADLKARIAKTIDFVVNRDPLSETVRSDIAENLYAPSNRRPCPSIVKFRAFHSPSVLATFKRYSALQRCYLRTRTCLMRHSVNSEPRNERPIPPTAAP